MAQKVALCLDVQLFVRHGELSKPLQVSLSLYCFVDIGLWFPVFHVDRWTDLILLVSLLLLYLVLDVVRRVYKFVRLIVRLICLVKLVLVEFVLPAVFVDDAEPEVRSKQ